MDFIIQTKDLGDFGNSISTEKSSVIQANSTLNLNAESGGKINKIFKKEWDFVKAGTVIATIADNVSNYDLQLMQAKNNINLQDASAETQLANLANSVSNADIAYKKALQTYNQLQEKTSLEYDNLVKSNNDTLKTYNDTYRSQLSALDAMMTQYLHSSDKIIGMTSQYENAVYRWQSYLGASNGEGTSKAEDAWNEVYGARGVVRAKLEDQTTFTDGDATENMKVVEDGYESVKKLADAMISMLQNSVFGGWLSTQEQTMWLQEWNSYRNAVQSSEGGFLSWKTQTNNFLENYKQRELATKIATQRSGAISAEDFNKLQKDQDLKLAYQNADLQTRQSLENAKLSVEQAKEALENAKKIQAATKEQLAVSRKNAEISLLQAERNASKLAIVAPISGTITKISAEIGQTVNNGTPVAEMAWAEAQALIEVDPRMALFLSIGQEVSATVGNDTISGKIVSVSIIGGKNLLSSVRIAFENSEKLIGQPTVIHLNLDEKINKNSFLLPINSVKIVSEWQGKISVLENGMIKTIDVQLGAMYGSGIEVFTDLPENTVVILTDVTNFNPETQNLRQEQ